MSPICLFHAGKKDPKIFSQMVVGTVIDHMVKIKQSPQTHPKCLILHRKLWRVFVLACTKNLRVLISWFFATFFERKTWVNMGLIFFLQISGSIFATSSWNHLNQWGRLMKKWSSQHLWGIVNTIGTYWNRFLRAKSINGHLVGGFNPFEKY